MTTIGYNSNPIIDERERRAQENTLAIISRTYHNSKVIREAEFLEEQEFIPLEDTGVPIPIEEHSAVEDLFEQGTMSALRDYNLEESFM